MKYNFRFLAILFYFFPLGIFGCRKFVEIDPPNNELVTASVFNNTGATTAAILAIYTQMQDRSYSMSLNCGLLSDELRNNSNDASMIGYYSNSMSASATPATLWNIAYNCIYQANAVIEALENNKDIQMAIRDQLAGEGMFIRAYWYFYLVNCYGDVPLVTSTDYTINSQLARTARSTIYQQVIADLVAAEHMLSNNFVDQSDRTITVDRVRPTKWAAAALLARVYLYTNDYAKAEMRATEVIDSSSLFTLEPALNKVFLANSSEAIWQLAVSTPTVINTYDGNGFILIAPPNNNGISNVCTISDQLLGAFEPGDQRRNSWIGSFLTADSPVIVYNFPFKYKVYQSSAVTENTMMLRLAEQYLIRAEARTQLGEDTGKIVADINSIRSRAGLINYAGATDKQSLLHAILHERQVEFFAEWGHRWFDLIRTGNANSVMGIVTPVKGGVWSSNWQLFPIPQADRQLDSHLSQNNGY